MKKETKIGIYLTVIVHLVALIIILSIQISSLIKRESSFVLDFSQQEQWEAEQRREQMRTEISEELDELISEIQRQTRNVAVDATQRNRMLRDDRHKDPEEVYKEAEALQKRLDAARKELEEQEGSEVLTTNKDDKKRKRKALYRTSRSGIYSGRTQGRKTPIPVYKCLGGRRYRCHTGRQKWLCEKGSHLAGFSSQDKCLQEYAIHAAGLSRFTASEQAPPLQPGEIVYRFIPQ